MKNSIRFLLASVMVFLAVAVIGAFAVLKCEAGAQGATIRTVSDALWWAVNMSSVGDAGIAPVTNAGRVVGGVLCLVGSALFTVNVGIIAGVATQMIRKSEGARTHGLTRTGHGRTRTGAGTEVAGEEREWVANNDRERLGILGIPGMLLKRESQTHGARGQAQ